MIPIGDDLPTLRFPLMTVLLLTVTWCCWLFLQGAGFSPTVLAASVCNLGLVPGELTHRAALGEGVPLGRGMACIIDNDAINVLTPLTSMFLHGGWMHILGNSLFLWVFGNNIEDSMGRIRFVAFYILCGLVAAAAQVALSPASPVPMVGASGAVSGILGAYLVLYPKVRVRTLFVFIIFLQVIRVPAWLMLIWWFGWQILAALPQLNQMRPDVSGGVAVGAHVGGFVAGLVLVHFFKNPALVHAHATALERHQRAVYRKWF